MKKRVIFRLLAILTLFSMIFCIGCDVADNANETTANGTDTQGTAETTVEETSEGTKMTETTTPPSKYNVDLTNEAEVFENADFRILLTSDMHHNYLETYYGLTSKGRMNAWVNAIKAEHEKRPFDLIVIMGDTSLDFWDDQWGKPANAPGGSYLNSGKSTTKEFVDNYVSKLPADVPVFVMAGNHEQYGNAKWKEMTGNDRQGSFVLGDNLFLFLDSFAGDLDPTTHHDGVSTAPDVNFIKSEMAKYPKHKVYLISHWFDLEKGGAEFKSIVNNSRVIALFQGHTHASTIMDLGAEYGYKKIAQTGQFSHINVPSGETAEENFWGFRDLVIVGKRSVSRYIVAESKNIPISSGSTVNIPRQINKVVVFNT